MVVRRQVVWRARVRLRWCTLAWRKQMAFVLLLLIFVCGASTLTCHYCNTEVDNERMSACVENFPLSPPSIIQCPAEEPFCIVRVLISNLFYILFVTGGVGDHEQRILIDASQLRLRMRSEPLRRERLRYALPLRCLPETSRMINAQA